MKTHSHLNKIGSLALALGVAPLLHAQVDTTHRLSVGSLLNLDGGGIPPGDFSADRAPLGLTDAELAIGLRLRPELEARTKLVHEDGVSKVDQACATWKTPGPEIVFGKTELPLGLYPGRLIHDPALQQDVETIASAVVASGAMGPVALHLSGANLAHQDDTVEIVFPAVVAAADLSWGEEGMLRVSTKVAQRTRVLDAAARIPIGPVLVDVEGVAADGAWSESDRAALLGLAWRPLDTVLLAARLDARRAKGADDWDKSIAAGATLRLAEFAYAGAEWLQDLDGDGVLTLRLGLEGGFSVP